MNRFPLRIAFATAACGLAALSISACGSSQDTPAGAEKLSFKLTDAGCEPNSAKAPAGPIAFEIENAGTSKVTEFEILDGKSIVGEKEDLTDGLSGSFSLTLKKGKYTIYCPGGSDERGTLTVTGA
jgi:iron uptake system component EfeO